MLKYEPDTWKSIEDNVKRINPVVSYDLYRKHFLTNYYLSFGFLALIQVRHVTAYKIAWLHQLTMYLKQTLKLKKKTTYNESYYFLF